MNIGALEGILFVVGEEGITKEKLMDILDIKEEEMEKYQQQLTDIMQEINKIEEVEIPIEDIMISPSDNKNMYSEDVIENHISRKDAFINAKRTRSDYITVPRVLEGEEE